MAVTVALGVGFLGLQVAEYIEAGFSIGNGVYGACFYSMTGLHGRR